MKTLSILAFALILAGCAQTFWTKGDFSRQEFLADRYACERDMRQSGHFGGGLLGEMSRQVFFNQCLESKGYWQVRE
jgi:hypothetical protein